VNTRENLFWSGHLFRKRQSTNVFRKSAGFFARHQSVARFRCEERLCQLFHAFVFLQAIRPDSPCHKLMEHGFGLAEGSISPGV